MNNISTENIFKIINDAETFAVLTHKRTDGDAISSSLAMYWYLIDIGKEPGNIDVLVPNFNEDFNFISGINHLKKEPTKDRYDLVIVVDCADEQRIEGAHVLKFAEKIICFDHHNTTSVEADYSIIDEKASSCTCILYRILPCTNSKFLSCIATGIISDTCNLKLNVTDECNEILNKLESLSIDIKSITKHLTLTSTRTQELTNLAIERGIYKKKGEHSIFCTYLLQEDFLNSEKNLDNVNHKAIINEVQKLVSYASLILLIENDKKEFKGSLRTSSKVDLNEVCSNLVCKEKLIKGGGHSYSAGCTAAVSGSNILECVSNIFEYISAEILNNK